jgi:glycine hydroxymethyltransferase
VVLCKEEFAKPVDSAVFPGVQGGPLMHVIAAKAVAFGEALRPEFVTYQKQVLANAKTLAEELMRAGFPVVSGGTDNHLMLVDVFTKAGIGGKKAEHALDAAGITVNKNMIPFDPRKPLDPSGVRIGTPALTTRGLKEPEMKQIAKWIADVLARPDDDDLLSRVRGEVREMGQQFPVPGEVAS